MTKQDKPYSHVKITEREKGQKPLLIKHRHPEKTNGNLTFTNKEGKELKVSFSAPSALNAEVYGGSFDEAFNIFWVVHDLYLAQSKKKPNQWFFYISNNRRSTHLDKSALNHVPNRILRILKDVRRFEKC